MGIELARLVATTCGGLRGNDYKVLNRMAVTALDRTNARGQAPYLYFGGWDVLAVAIGQQVAPEGLTKSQEEQVRRAIRNLKSAGLIEPLEAKARAGIRQTYRLRLALSPNESAGHEPPQGVGARSQRTSGAKPLHSIGASPAETSEPRRTQESTEGLDEDITLTSAPYVESDGVASLDNPTPHGFDDDGSHKSCAACALPAGHPVHSTVTCESAPRE
jgi:hypothetical protein